MCSLLLLPSVVPAYLISDLSLPAGHREAEKMAPGNKDIEGFVRDFWGAEGNAHSISDSLHTFIQMVRSTLFCCCMFEFRLVRRKCILTLPTEIYDASVRFVM